MLSQTNKGLIRGKNVVFYQMGSASFWIKDSFERSEPAFKPWMAFLKVQSI